MNTFHKRFRLLSLSAAIALASGTIFAADRTIVVLQSITGAGAFVGAPAVEGMKFAAEELNAKGFLGPDKINVIVVDSASDRGQAMSAVNRYGNDPNVLAILGPTTAPEAIPSAAIANELKVPMMACPTKIRYA